MLCGASLEGINVSSLNPIEADFYCVLMFLFFLSLYIYIYIYICVYVCVCVLKFL